MISIGYDDIINNQRQCYQDFNIIKGDKIPIDAACYEKFASLTVFFYIGDDFDIEDCEACSLPSDGTEGYIAIVFEIPCEPICETPSAVPNDCVDQAIVAETIPDDVMIGSEIITIVGLDKDSVLFNVDAFDNLDMVAVSYRGLDQSLICDQRFNVTAGASMQYTAACADNFSSVTVFMYIGDEFDVDQCDACSISDGDVEGYIAINFELPCISSCETSDPTLAPTLLLDLIPPVDLPSDAPTKTQTGNPTLTPTGELISTPSASTPTELENLPEFQSLCVDYMPIVELAEGIGDVGNYSWDASLITINEQLGDSVTFTISQQLSTETPNYWSIHYEGKSEAQDCDAHTDEEATYGSKFEYTAICHSGKATVNVYLRSDGTSADECDTCGAPLDGDLDFVAYYVQIPCEPECIPEEPECYAGIMAMHKDTGGDPMCEYSSQPFTIEELDETGTNNEVRFSFTNNWPTSSNIELSYDRGDGSGQQCQSLNSLSSGDMYPNTLAAACDPETKTADIEVYVSNNIITHSSSRNKCGVGPGSCSFVYKIPCSTDILCDDVRRLEDNIGDKSGGNDNIEQGFMTEEMKAAGELSEDSDDAPYCVHEDYPCNGDEEKMVYICHYSRQKGYQTFCIPEMDSDILQFDGRNHCGKCDGWNGVELTGQII